MNNFSGGAISDKLESRDDSELYSRSGLIMHNMLPMSQGPMVRAPGTQYIEALEGETRIIEFPISEQVVYIVELSNLEMRIRRNDAYVMVLTEPLVIPHPWTGDEIFQVQYARDARTIYFAHENHPPKHLTYLGLDAFQVDALEELPSIAFTTNPDETLPFQNTGNYPRATALWGGRLWFGFTTAEPGTVWASRTFDYTNHEYYQIVEYTYTQLSDNQTWADPAEPETEEVTTTKKVMSASHAMKLVPASGRNTSICSMAPGRDLIVNTAETEFVIPAGVTAANPQIQPRTSFGARQVQSALGDNAVIFVQGSGTRVREYKYRSDDEGYSSPELTFMNDQVCAAGISHFAIQREPEPIIWFVLNDGTVAAFLYNKNAGAAGWFTYSMDGAEIVSVCVVPGVGKDDVYFVVNRDDAYSIEKLAPLFPANRAECRYLHSYVEAVSSGAGVVTGLSHLEGLSVLAWNRTVGSEIGAFIVSGGQISLGSGNANTNVAVGVSYTSQWKSLRQNARDSRGKKQNIFQLRMRLWRADAGRVSYDNVTGHEEAMRIPTPWHTGDIEVPFRGDWNTEGYVYIESVGAAPLGILSFEPEQEVS